MNKPSYKIAGYVTWGSVRGEGPVRASFAEADKDARQDSHGCRRQGGYSDRDVYPIDDEGYVRDDEDYVWPHGPTSAALCVDVASLTASLTECVK